MLKLWGDHKATYKKCTEYQQATKEKIEKLLGKPQIEKKPYATAAASYKTNTINQTGLEEVMNALKSMQRAQEMTLNNIKEANETHEKKIDEKIDELLKAENSNAALIAEVENNILKQPVMDLKK